MKLIDILDKQNIVYDLIAQDKKDAIKKLVDILYENRKIDDREKVFQAILEREKLVSTGIGDNIAIPHVKLKEVRQIALAIGRSKDGIEFDSIDNKKVNFVFMLIAPETSTNLHLKALARISRFLKNSHFRETLLHAKDHDDLFRIIKEGDSKL